MGLDDLWRELEGRTVDDGLQLGVLHSATPVPVFTGLYNGKPVMVRFYSDDTETGSIYDRHREAQFLVHPNLLRCLDAGRTTLPDGSSTVYGIYERPQAFLSDLADERALNASEARTLCEDVVAGLQHLHQNGLVYCNLDRATVAHAGDRWALCDYSQLRTAGTGYAAETRKLMGSIAGAPPEAFNGVVTPAWDTWSVAHLLRGVFQDPKTARELKTANASGRVPRNGSAVPEPFASLASACLVPDPGARCSLNFIEEKLHSVRSTREVEPAPVLAAEAERPVRSSADADATVITLPETAEERPVMHGSVRDARPLRPQRSERESFRLGPAEPDDVRSGSKGPYRPRYQQDDDDSEPTSFFRQFSWRALLAGIVAVFLIALAMGLLRRAHGDASSPQATGVPQQEQQQAGAAPVTNGASNNADGRPTPVDQSPAAPPSDSGGTRSRVADPSAADGSAQSQVEDLVRKWAGAFQRRDMNEEMKYYAPRLRRFFQASNVPVSFVEKTKVAALKDAGQIRAYDLSNLETRLDSPGAATVTFDKTWDFAGRLRHTGKVRGELKLEKYGNDWRIVSERDLKVYRQSRTRA